MKVALALMSMGLVAAKYQRCPALEKKQTALLSKMMKKNPGVGVDLEKVKAGMDKVYKDGYYHVACVNDGMREFADKHGISGKLKYAAQNVDVSIVWYNDLTPKEDMEDMTPKVCYNFCRRVEGMNFFGIQNGRGCYCTPYYKQQTGAGSEDCDMPCDGNPAIMCGGKTKSDIFQMHWCGDVAENLGKSVGLVEGKRMELEDVAASLETCAGDLQSAGEELQKATAKAGDKFSGEHAMALKKSAGEYMKMFRTADKSIGMADAATMNGKELKSGDEKSPENAVAAEAALEELDMAELKVQDSLDAVTKAVDACNAPTVEAADEKTILNEYFNIAKWTAAGFEEHSTTCKGEVIAVSSGTPASCAKDCDTTVHPVKCVAYQQYDKTCVLFSEVTEVSYYSEMDCPTVEKAMCSLKMSESVGFAPKDGVAKQARCFF